jgi:hypothetical protein
MSSESRGDRPAGPASQPTEPSRALEQAIRNLNWGDVLQAGCRAILADVANDAGGRYEAVGKMLAAAKGIDAGWDMCALVEVIAAIAQRIAERDECLVAEVVATLLPLDPDTTPEGRMQRATIRAVRAWFAEGPYRGRILAMNDVTWIQARVEAIRVGSALVADHDAVDELRFLHGDIVPVIEAYGLPYVVRDLRRLLAQPLLGSPEGPDGPWNQRLLGLSAEIDDGADEDELHFDALQLALLRSDLQQIADHDQRVLGRIRSKVRGNRAGLFGLRCEIAVASRLASRGRSFVYDARGRPDFQVGDVGIECTSRRRAEGNDNLIGRIRGAVADKGKKNYAGSTVGLVVEVTNLQARSVEAGHGLLGRGDLSDQLKPVLRDSGLGLVVLLSTLHDHRSRLVYRVVSLRLDSDSIAPELVTLADELWPGRPARLGPVSAPNAP